MKYTKEEKKEYFKNLRKEWKKSKEMADNDEVAKAIYREAGLNHSFHSFFFVHMQMQELGFDGLPYVDMKTYKKWQESGFQVNKGEKAKVKGITWIEAQTKSEDGEEENEETFVFPKVYKLFHRSQVTEI